MIKRRTTIVYWFVDTAIIATLLSLTRYCSDHTFWVGVLVLAWFVAKILTPVAACILGGTFGFVLALIVVQENVDEPVYKHSLVFVLCVVILSGAFGVFSFLNTFLLNYFCVPRVKMVTNSRATKRGRS